MQVMHCQCVACMVARTLPRPRWRPLRRPLPSPPSPPPSPPPRPAPFLSSPLWARSAHRTLGRQLLPSPPTPATMMRMVPGMATVAVAAVAVAEPGTTWRTVMGTLGRGALPTNTRKSTKRRLRGQTGTVPHPRVAGPRVGPAAAGAGPRRRPRPLRRRSPPSLLWVRACTSRRLLDSVSPVCVLRTLVVVLTSATCPGSGCRGGRSEASHSCLPGCIWGACAHAFQMHPALDAW